MQYINKSMREETVHSASFTILYNFIILLSQNYRRLLLMWQQNECGVLWS